MDNLLKSIRSAVVTDATAEARATGIAACRTILAALDASPDQPFVPAVAPNASAIADAVGALRGVPPDQLLEIAIGRLRAALPAGVDVPSAQPLKFHIIHVPKLGAS